MSDDEDDYEYEYDEDEDNMEEENQFQYTDEEDEQDDGMVALENAYYNAKGLRETSVSEATAALEQVIAQEQEQLKKEGKKYGMWSYKAMKQLVKLHLRVGSSGNGVLDQETIMKYYRRLLECISTNGSDISPAAVEKGINTMLERVASVNYNARSPEDPTNSPRTLALAVYDATLTVFHPKTGPYKIERLWFKTNLKYGQLLYEMNETAKLQQVLKDLIQIHGEPDDIIQSSANASGSSSSGGASASTNSMEIYALQIQLYSRQKDNRKLRETFHKAMSVRGGIPHPRTIALIQGTKEKANVHSNESTLLHLTFVNRFILDSTRTKNWEGRCTCPTMNMKKRVKPSFKPLRAMTKPVTHHDFAVSNIWCWRACCMPAASIRLILKRHVRIATIQKSWS
jgi:COP9 signalosome complex subunit 2